MTDDFIALPGGSLADDPPGGSLADDTPGGSLADDTPGGSLAGERGWRIWRGLVLRGAGFPVRDIDLLADPDLAAAADRALARAAGAGRDWPAEDDLSEYHELFGASVQTISAAIARLARQPRFLEALTWQNPGFVRTCVDHLDSAGKRSPSRLRKRQAVTANYLQRYTTKNDSIGFFGPVGWADWTTQDRACSLRAGPDLVRRRTVYFETWAIDEVAAAFAGRPELMHGVAPRRSPANLLDGNRVVRPNGSTEMVGQEWAQILRLCDGWRPVREIAATIGCAEPWLLEQLELMDKSGLIRMDLSGPIEVHGDRRLAQRLSRVPAAGPRQAALAELTRLVSAKDEVAAAAGHPQRLGAALGAVAAQFETITGQQAVRLPGQAYAARTILYEDCIRDVQVTLGADVLASLGESLALVLHSARWLTARIGAAYLTRLGERFQRLRQRAGTDWLPLGRLLAAAAPDFYAGTGIPELAVPSVREMQRRWAAILAVPDQARQHRVEPADIAAQVRAQFRSGSPQWAGGLRHSPDIMIDAASVEAINAGDYQFVLGELHTAFNTVEITALAEQSEQKARLLAMAEHAAGPSRIVLTPSRDWDYVTRTRPLADLLSSTLVHWAAGSDDVGEVATEVLPLGALEVGRAGSALVVRCRTDQRSFPLAEVVGDYLSQVLIACFAMLAPAPHSPRVCIGPLVVSRETWRLTLPECDWALHQKLADERLRFLQLRQWATRHGLPRRVFCSLPGEAKPVYADLTSIPLTNSLATMLRRIGRDDTEHVSFSEMLPGPDGCWLSDEQGAAYVSELRLVVSER